MAFTFSPSRIVEIPTLPWLPPLHNTRSSFIAGLRDQSPGIIGNIPFGLIAGASSTAAGMDPLLAMGMSIILFAGAAQLAAISLMAQHAPAFIVVLTVLVVNLRLVMYSAAVAPHFRHTPKARKWFFAYLLTDHAFALVTTKFNKRDEVPHFDAYYFGATSGMWIVWQVSVAIGVFAGTLVPLSWSLDFVIPLVFLSLVLPALQTRAHWAAAIVAGTAAAFLTSLPLKLGLITAATCGVMIGAMMDKRVAPTVVVRK